MSLVDVTLSPDPGAETSCRRGEYWLVRAGAAPQSRLLAIDCDAQWGPDTLGHAETSVEGSTLSVKYEQMGASDRCQGYEAAVELAPLFVAREVRWSGLTAQGVCRRQNVIETDWRAAAIRARWESCAAKPGSASRRGFAVSELVFRGETEKPVVSLGNCATVMGTSASPANSPDDRTRALIIGSGMWVQARAGSTGRITMASTARTESGDVDGAPACGVPPPTVATSVVELHDGRVTATSGAEARVMSAIDGHVLLRIELGRSVGRVTIAYDEAKRGGIARSERLRAPRADELAPVITMRSCRWNDGRIETVSTVDGAHPLLSLSASDEPL